MFDSSQPHGLQHARFSCPSLSPRVCSYSCPLSRWCYVAISSSVAPFSCLQTFPASGSFPMSWLFTSGGQSWCFSLSISPSNEYSGLISFDWLDLLAVQGTLKSLLQHHSSKASVLWHSAFFTVQFQWQPTPIFLPRELRGQRSLVGCHLWDHTESDTTEVT